MPDEQATTYAGVVEYERRRAAVKAHYTTRLKSMTATDPEYARLWDERSRALRTLAEAFQLPIEEGSR